MDNNAQTSYRVGSSITYLTDSNTIKNAGIGLIPIEIPVISAAALV